MKQAAKLLPFLILLCLTTNSLAHTGGRDAYGCHNNSLLNVYECHAGKFVGRSWPNPGGKVKMLAELTPAAPAVVFENATLNWTPNTEANLAGYKLYWGLEAGKYQKPIDLGKVTHLPLSNLLKGATYFFVVTAYNIAGKESGFSNEVSKSL